MLFSRFLPGALLLSLGFAGAATAQSVGEYTFATGCRSQMRSRGWSPEYNITVSATILRRNRFEPLYFNLIDTRTGNRTRIDIAYVTSSGASYLCQQRGTRNMYWGNLEFTVETNSYGRARMSGFSAYVSQQDCEYRASGEMSFYLNRDFYTCQYIDGDNALALFDTNANR